MAGVMLALAGSPLRALAIVTASPTPSATVAPAATPLPGNSTVLPLESSLFFVLDETISSHASKGGSFVRAHLRDPLVVNGITVAPKGAPVQIEIVHATGAQMGNVDGEVEIYFEPLDLPDGKKLTLNTPTAHINPHMSSGQYNTQAVEDTVGDIFVPYHYMYHMLRKGHEVDLRPGTVIRARTAESIAINHGTIVLATPRPFNYSIDAPHSDFSPTPFATPRENPTPPPKSTPTPSPKPTATP
ncbi:MAG: hypothetical protein ACXVAK_00910 [Vulcanimicrobiaceae bacterium]